MHLHAIPPHKVQKSPPLNVQSYRQDEEKLLPTYVHGHVAKSNPPYPFETMVGALAPPGGAPATRARR